MLNIFLIRHASTDYSSTTKPHSLAPLSKLGALQSEELALKLVELDKRSTIKAIYSSNQPRSIQTITPFSKAVNLKINEFENLREHRYNGDSAEFHRKILKDSHYKHPGGENLQESYDRFLTTIELIARNHKNNENIIIVTHGTLLNQLMVNKFGYKSDNFFDISYPDIYLLKFDKKYNKHCLVRVSGLLPGTSWSYHE